MEAPNRRSVIETIIKPYAYLWDDSLGWPANGGGGKNNFNDLTLYENRVRSLLPLVVDGLNRTDRDWLVLHKWDRGPKATGIVPYDIIVWGQTLEHFDIFTDKFTVTWGENGVLPTNKTSDETWKAISVSEAKMRGLVPMGVYGKPGNVPIPQPPQPTPTPQPQPEPVELEGILSALRNLAEINAQTHEALVEVNKRLQGVEQTVLELEDSLVPLAESRIADAFREIIAATEFVGRNRYLGEIVMTPRTRK